MLECRTEGLNELYDILQNHRRLRTLKLYGVQPFPYRASMKNFFTKFSESPIRKLKLEFNILSSFFLPCFHIFFFVFLSFIFSYFYILYYFFDSTNSMDQDA